MTELELLIEEQRHIQTVTDLKAVVASDPSKIDELRAAKQAHREFRAFWRGIRRLQQDLALEGDPEAAARVLAEIGAGGAIAAPATLNTGITAGDQP